MTQLKLEKPGTVVIGIFTPIQAVTIAEGGLFSVCSKNATSMPPPLCIIEQAETCSDELLTAWLLQVQQFLTDLLLSKKPCAIAESEVNAG